MRSIYVAGASTEMDRARRAVEQLRAAGVEVTCTWLEVIADVGNANPTDVTPPQRRAWSTLDLAEVSRADVLWFLVPVTAQTRGAWVELGHAYASGKWIICSGATTTQSIFTALGAEFATDEEALRFIVGTPRTLRTRRVTVPPMPADVSVTVSDVDDRFDHGDGEQ